MGLVDVGDVQAEPDARQPLGVATGGLRVLPDLEDRLADLDLRVANATRRRGVAFELSPVEDSAVEVDGPIGIAYDQVWPYGAKSSAFVP